MYSLPKEVKYTKNTHGPPHQEALPPRAPVPPSRTRRASEPHRAAGSPRFSRDRGALGKRLNAKQETNTWPRGRGQRKLGGPERRGGEPGRTAARGPLPGGRALARCPRGRREVSGRRADTLPGGARPGADSGPAGSETDKEQSGARGGPRRRPRRADRSARPAGHSPGCA